MSEPQEISWQAPPFERPDKDKLAFAKRCIESGIKWNQEQCSSDDLTRALDILSGKTGCALSGKWANITTGDTSRQLRANSVIEHAARQIAIPMAKR